MSDCRSSSIFNTPFALSMRCLHSSFTNLHDNPSPTIPSCLNAAAPSHADLTSHLRRILGLIIKTPLPSKPNVLRLQSLRLARWMSNSVVLIVTVNHLVSLFLSCTLYQRRLTTKDSHKHRQHKTTEHVQKSSNSYFSCLFPPCPPPSQFMSAVLHYPPNHPINFQPARQYTSPPILTSVETERKYSYDTRAFFGRDKPREEVVFRYEQREVVEPRKKRVINIKSKVTPEELAQPERRCSECGKWKKQHEFNPERKTCIRCRSRY